MLFAHRRLRFVPVLAMAASLIVPSAVHADVAGMGLALPLSLPNGASVSGRVTDADGHPVAGATAGVCAKWYDCFKGFTQTAADGRWTVRGLAPGKYFVEVMPAFGSNLLSAAWTGSGGGSHDLESAVAVNVTANRTGLDLVMPTGLRITGTVVDPDGGPVEGVSVFASGPTASSSLVASDAAGHWEAVGLEPGVPYTLQVNAGHGFPSGWFDGTTVVQVPDVETMYTATLAEADITGVAITLAAGRRIAGHLDGVGGRAIDVIASGGGGSGGMDAVDGDGNFEVDGLWPGLVVLDVAPHPAGPGDNEYPYGTWNGQGQLLDPAQGSSHLVDVRDTDVVGLTALVPVLPTVGGTVTAPGGPLAGASVALCGVASAPGCMIVTTQADGTWQARNVPADTYIVRAGAPVHPTAWYAASGTTTDPAAASDVVVADADVAGVDIAIPAAKEIRGWVTGPDGLGVAGVEITAIPEGRFDDDWGPGPAITDGDGTFAVDGLLPGDYRLCARPPQGSVLRSGCWASTGWTADYQDAELIHVVANDATPPVVAAPSVGIAGGAPLAGALVPVRSAWTGSDDTSGIDHFAVTARTAGGAWSKVASTHHTATRLDLAAGTASWQVGVQATDGSGNASSRAAASFRVGRTQETGSGISWGGAWRPVLAASASGGSYRVAGAAGASVTYTFTGRSVGWVAAGGPSFGAARVYVDGVLVKTVNLHSASATARTVVFTRTWATSGAHTLRI
ncbi:MAG: carboxypeptidase-like regulatory domain-containing protein, partial [Chloroflexota bacterium]